MAFLAASPSRLCKTQEPEHELQSIQQRSSLKELKTYLKLKEITPRTEKKNMHQTNEDIG